MINTPFSFTAADSPTDLNVVQVNLTSIRVSWTQPATVTGYQVYWSGDGGADSGDIIVGAGDTDVTITGRTPGLTYDITIVALSDQLPGPPAKATITLGESIVVVYLICRLCLVVTNFSRPVTLVALQVTKIKYFAAKNNIEILPFKAN